MYPTELIIQKVPTVDWIKMSFAVLHMDKFKREAVRGIQSHNQRERKSHSNPDINYQRSSENYDLHNDGPVNFTAVINERVDSLNLQKAPRHDAVYMCGILVSSDSSFFERIGEEETRRFFEESYQYLSTYVGPENVISAVVHMDEKNPHLHFNHVPITEDGRLNANKIYTRDSLKKLQTDFPKFLQSKGFDIERGIEQKPGAAKKHLNTVEFKQQQEAISNLKKEAEVTANQLEEIKTHARAAESVLAAEKDLPSISSWWQVKKSDYDKAMERISHLKKALADKSRIEAENKKLKSSQAYIDKRISLIESQANQKIQQHQEAARKAVSELQSTKSRVTALESNLAKIEKFLKLPEVQGLYQRFMASEQNRAAAKKRRSFTP